MTSCVSSIDCSVCPKRFDIVHGASRASDASSCLSDTRPTPLCRTRHLPCMHSSATENQRLALRPKCHPRVPNGEFCIDYSCGLHSSACPLLFVCDVDCRRCNVSCWLLLLLFVVVGRAVLLARSILVRLVQILLNLKKCIFFFNKCWMYNMRASKI